LENADGVYVVSQVQAVVVKVGMCRVHKLTELGQAEHHPHAIELLKLTLCILYAAEHLNNI
jgi:hypothetical protein